MSVLTDILSMMSLAVFRNAWKLGRKAEALAGREPKADIARLEYSYYCHEAPGLGIQASSPGKNMLQLRQNGSVQNIFRAYTDLDGEATLMMAGDKAFCSSVLKRHGVPVPDSVVLKSGDYRGAAAFRRRLDAPIVVKPARDTGDGRGVSLRPEGIFSLWRAVSLAGVFGREILVERFCEGTNYRLLYCRGEFLAASSRNPARVTGDGVHTVRGLIHRANRGRLDTGRIVEYDPATRPILYRIPVTPSLAGLVKRQGLTLDSVPPAGSEILTQNVCHWLFGGEYRDVTNDVSPDFVALGKRAADILGIKLAGIDLIARDIRSARPGTFVVNEVNTSPGLLVHYEVQNRREMRPVAREIIRSMFFLKQTPLLS